MSLEKVPNTDSLGVGSSAGPLDYFFLGRLSVLQCDTRLLIEERIFTVEEPLDMVKVVNEEMKRDADNTYKPGVVS